MNKIKKIAIILLIFFSCITITNAKNIFELDWKTEDYTLEFITGITDYNTRNIEFNDGYVTTQVEETEEGLLSSYITQYDYDGKEIKKVKIGGGVFLDIVTDGTYLYTLAGFGDSISLVKLDNNFDIVKEYAFSKEISIGIWDMFYSEVPLSGLNLLSVTEDGIGIIYVDYDMIFVTNDFATHSYVTYDEDILKKYFPELYGLEGQPLTDVYYYNYKTNNEYIVLSGIVPNECLTTSTECEYDSTAIMTLQDKNGEELWSKEYTEYKEFLNTILIDDYIVTIGVKDLNDLAPSAILVMDYDGNILQTIENENSYYYLRASSKGLIVTNYQESLNTGNDGITKINSITTSTEVYQLIYQIEALIAGKGQIKVVETSKSGETVKVTLIPDEGYTLGKITVTDKVGNKIVYKDGEFTMPSANVTIEVEFIGEREDNPLNQEENPETSDITIISLIGISIIGGTAFIISKRKLAWLK